MKTRFDPNKVPEGYEVDEDMFGSPFLRPKYTPLEKTAINHNKPIRISAPVKMTVRTHIHPVELVTSLDSFSSSSLVFS